MAKDLNRHLTEEIYSWKIAMEIHSASSVITEMQIKIQDTLHSYCYVDKSCPALLQPHGLRNPPGPSVYRISQARILEWVAISFSRGSFKFRART